jgi:threonine/homoserine/homoserine lactone efflux protein
MTTEILLALSAFAFVSSITPGPNNLMLMASGTNFGFRRTLPHLLGVNIGFTLMIVLVGAGLVRLFDAYPVAHSILKVVSVIYLLWLAWKIATSPAPGTSATRNQASASARPFTFTQAALFQWVNPKAWSMALSAVSAYAAPTRPVQSLFVIALVFGVINLPAVSSWALLGVRLRHFLDQPRKLRIFNVIAAVILVMTLYPVLFSGSAVRRHACLSPLSRGLGVDARA